MRIACVLTFKEAVANPADVFLFPEGVTRRTLGMTAEAFPRSIVVGAYEQDRRCRAVLLFRGRNWVHYEKMGTDGFGRTEGVGYWPRAPIFEIPEVCIGLFICMDVDNSEFSLSVTNSVRASQAKAKLICIAGDMRYDWFYGGASERLSGMHVALCNNIRNYTGASRRKSFITNTNRIEVASQRDCETISYDFTQALESS